MTPRSVSRTRRLPRVAGVAVVTAMLAARTADAAPEDRERCATSAEQAQQLLDEGKYRSAREQLSVCARDVCPAVIKNDCVKWLTELDRNAPTVVFGAQDEKGDDVVDVRVSIDGIPVQERLDGKPVLVDSGEHALKFERAGAVKERRILVRAGERARPIAVTFDAGVATDTPKQRQSGSLVVPLVVGGVGVLALGSFAFFGIGGSSDATHLRNTCSPHCAQSDVDSARQKALIADISLGVGVVALGVATYLFLTRPTLEAPRAQPSPPAKAPSDKGTSLRFDVGPVASGGYAGIGGRF